MRSGRAGAGGGIVIEPEMLDISVPAGTVFTPSAAGRAHRLCLYLPGRGISTIGAMPMPMKWSVTAGRTRSAAASAQPETVVLFEHAGDAVQVTTTGKAGAFSVCFGKADGRAGGLVRPDRHEYPGGAEDRI